MGNLYVNGLQVDVTSASFNFFKLLKVLRKELEFHDRVATLPLQPDFIGVVSSAITRIVASEVSYGVAVVTPGTHPPARLNSSSASCRWFGFSACSFPRLPHPHIPVSVSCFIRPILLQRCCRRAPKRPFELTSVQTTRRPSCG
jgi:hypothetical protein